jgi:putative ABC transport system permease protein
VLLTLALGIGANTAIFSIVDAALLRPLPYRESGRLVQLNADLPGVGAHNVGFSVPEFEDLRDRAGIFEDVSVSWQAPGNLTGGEHPERIEFIAVSPNYFRMLGVPPQLGRVFDARDIADGFAEAAVISNDYWHKEFGGDPNIVGRRIRLDNDLYTIVGVLPPSFRPPTAATAREVEGWITAGFRADPFPSPQRSRRFLPAIVGRLKPGISLRQAQAQLAIFADRLRSDNAVDYPAASGWTLTAAPLQDIVIGNSRTLLISLLLAVALILLIACVNVANILLANASARQREISIRLALGADRRRIIRQLLTESAILSVAATIIGTISAAASLRSIAALIPTQLPHVNSIGIDLRVLGFSLLIALLTTVGFGLMPALQAARSDADIDTLRGRSSSVSIRDGRLGKMLIGAEVALSVMLLVGAGLLLGTFWRLLHVDPGFQTSHVITANVWLPVPNDPRNDVYIKPDQRALLIRESLRRLRSVPGFEDAAISSVVPLQDGLQPIGFRVEGAPENGDAPTAVRAAVSPDFFKTLGAPLIRGRAIEDTDTTQNPLVAVVDEAAAHRFWGDRTPIGQRFRAAQTFIVDGKPQPYRWFTVVGVVSNIKLARLDEYNVPHIYGSMYQTPGRLLGVLVRATGDKAEIGHAIQREIQAVDPNLPVASIAEMKEIVNNGVGDRRFAAWLLAIFAAMALLLTSVGIYGVTSYAIARRTREIGIRSALGAQPRDLVRMVIVNGMSPIVAGLAIGALGAIFSAKLIAALLYGVSSTDAAVYAAAAFMVVVVGITANYVPARRAARADPIVALRVE